MDETTIPEDADAASHREPLPTVLALVVAWCPPDPKRVGEVLLVPPTKGEPRVFGRGPARTDDPHPRLQLVRQRPAALQPAEPLSLNAISRVQIVVHALGDKLRIENVGMCKLLERGAPVTSIEVGPRDLVQLGQQILFVCVRRTPWWPAAPSKGRIPAFGEPDDAGLVGESEATWRVRAQIEVLAGRDEHVFVRGESGSGKELAARAIHAKSPRSNGPLVARNAATIPAGIADAELFGNAKNYPNPGMVSREGLVGEANGGVLFLDEIGELPTESQARLLRVLDGGEYQRLGDSSARKSDFRLVGATNRPSTSLKHDLLARLPLRLELPGLDDRIEDVPLLAAHLLRRMTKDDASLRERIFPEDPRFPHLDLAFVRKLLAVRWTTHVRELEALLLAAVMRGPGRLHLSDLPESPRPVSSPSITSPEEDALGDDEGAALSPARIQEILDEHNGVIERAYRALGLSSRHALARLIKKHGLELRRRPR